MKKLLPILCLLTMLLPARAQTGGTVVRGTVTTTGDARYFLSLNQAQMQLWLGFLTNGTVVNGTSNLNFYAGSNMIVYAVNGSNIFYAGVMGKSDATNIAQSLVTSQATTSHKIISLTAPVDGDTNWFGPWTPGTHTAGVQEALNSLPLAAASWYGGGGGTVEVQPGVYYTTANIHLPAGVGSTPYSLSIFGSGMLSSALVYNGSTPDELIHYGNDNSSTPYILSIENMVLASANNATTNIVKLEGADTVGGGGGGGVARAKIHFCYFTYWKSATNNTCFGFPVLTPSSCSDSVAHNLIGINVNLNYNDPISITECSFAYLQTPIAWACDHGIVQNNTFEQCGNIAGLSSWPTSSPFYPGPTILLQDPASLVNGNKDWRFQGNNFVNCPLHYLSTLPYTPYTSSTFTADINNILIQDDTDEVGVALAATVGAPLTFLNPKGYYNGTNASGGIIKPALTVWAIPNPANYSTWNTSPAPQNPAGGSNVIAIVDFRRGTNTTSQQFGGNISALAGLYVGQTSSDPVHPWNADFLNPSGYRQLRMTAATDDAFWLMRSGNAGSSNLFIAATSPLSGLNINSLVFGYTSPGADAGTSVPMMWLNALDKSATFTGQINGNGAGLTAVNAATLTGIGTNNMAISYTNADHSLTIPAKLNLTNSPALSGFFVATNSAPPAAADVGGSAFVWNSNGYAVYILTSGPGSTAWLHTNKFSF